MRISTLFTVAALAAVLSLPCRLLADGVVFDGIGPISTGRGATNLAFADNAAIINDNPAGMSNVQGSGLMEGGVDTCIPSIQYSDPQNPNVSNVIRGYPMGFFGYMMRPEDSCFTYGIGVFAPAGFGADYFQNSPIFGNTLYRSLGLMAKVLPAISYQVNDRLSVGATAGLALGHISLAGPFFVQTGPFAGTPTLLDLHATGVAACGGLGLQYLLTDQTTMGIAYTEQTTFHMDGNARATFGPLVSGFDAKAGIKWPRSLGIGFKHNLCCCQRVGLDIVYYNWHQAFSQFPLTFTNPTNPIVGGLLGNTFHDSFPAHWHDTVSYRFGYERDLGDLWTWRGGYIYHPSPAPNATLNSFTDGVLLHTFSLGCSRQMWRGSTNFSYQYTFGGPRTVGTSSIVGGDFSNSTLAAQAHIINISYLIPF